MIGFNGALHNVCESWHYRVGAQGHLHCVRTAVKLQPARKRRMFLRIVLALTGALHYQH